jgi:alkylated DNA repair dioxygenase AlkB
VDLFKSKLPFEIPLGEGYAVHELDGVEGYRVVVPNGELVYIEHFFSQKISDRSVEYFLENDALDWRTAKWKELTSEQLAAIRFANILWKQDSIKLYGKIIPLPRLTAWYGDSGKSYTYAGIKSEPNEWNKGLLYLKQEAERLADVEFNSVLLNWYRDGEDYLNWHADDEKELGLNPVIGSVNFGETRDFLLRRNVDASQKITLPLKHGTLLVMRGELQHHWQHSVPKRKRVNGSRFNLTFRRIGGAP